MFELAFYCSSGCCNCQSRQVSLVILKTLVALRFKKHLRVHNRREQAETFLSPFLLVTGVFVRHYHCISPSFMLLSGNLCTACLCCLQVTHPVSHNSSWSPSRVVFWSCSPKDLGCRSSYFPALPLTLRCDQGHL